MQHKSQPEAIAANEPSAPRDWTHKRASRFQKSVCLLISAAILNSLCLPLVHARIAQRNQQAQEEVWRGQSDPAASYAAALDRLDQLLTPPTTAAAATARGASAAPALAPLKTQLEQQAQTLRQQWQTLRATWQKARVAPEILARQ
ncbi:MAG: hypothetical protein LBP52_06730, partial [Burkholderiaceae bacterium]|nr:hypothetical protein [Burkholderiaceae bacterium]